MGVALGVAFFIAVASLMRGSEADFIRRLVDSSPHITIKDEFRKPPRQPVEWFYGDGAVALRGVKPRDEVRGIRNQRQILQALSRNPDATTAPALLGQVILRYGAKDVAASIDRHRAPAEAAHHRNRGRHRDRQPRCAGDVFDRHRHRALIGRKVQRGAGAIR